MNKESSTHTLSKTEVLRWLGTSERGLTSKEAVKRFAIYGANKLPEGQKLRVIRLFISQFANAMTFLMGGAATLSFLFDHIIDAFLIAFIMLFNAVMGFIQEYRAEQSVNALKRLLVAKVLVRRDGRTLEITQDQVTVGDLVELQAGDRVPADAYVLEASNFSVDESSLTGESQAVEKKTGVVQASAPIAERFNRVWMGTTVAQGTAQVVVTAIGTQTEFGKIATSLQTVSKNKEHFSQKITVLSRQMGAIAILSATFTFLVGFFIRNFSLPEISVYTIATLVSALPEGLPVILVIVLTVGAQRMARKNAIVRKLSATETLGVVSVIITDKTGTLTQNIMSAKKIFLPGQEMIDVSEKNGSQTLAFYQQDKQLALEDNKHLRRVLSITGVCHHIKVSDQTNVTYNNIYGDPTEKALFLLSHRANSQQTHEHQPRLIYNLPFQQHLRMRGCLVATEDKNELLVLGAPESILDRCKFVWHADLPIALSIELKSKIEAKMDELSSAGLRIVALASFPTKEQTSINANHLDTHDGTFIGLIGLYDPPRPEVKAALIQARRAGIKIIMATGDHPQTALTIAKEIGLVPIDYSRQFVLTQTDLEQKSDQELGQLLQRSRVLARLSPESKMRVASIFQDRGEVVAMTGDGVNDAPALKKADVGIAMGVVGTQVAREASKIVLADDNFASIVAAIKEGRTQFSNLRRTSFFLIMTNFSESAALLAALILGYPLPLLPLQILWLNVITGGMTDFALSLEPTHEETMTRPPRQARENILNFSVLPLILIIAFVTTVLCILVFHYFLPQGVDKARTALFVVLSCSQFLNMFNLRSLKKSVFELGFFTNKAVVIASIFSLGFLISAFSFEPIRSALQFASLSLVEFSSLILLSSVIFIVAEISKRWLVQGRVTDENSSRSVKKCGNVSE